MRGAVASVIRVFAPGLAVNGVTAGYAWGPLTAQIITVPRNLPSREISGRRIYWIPGRLNYADYWTKHHPAAHHQNTRKEFITPYVVLEMLQLEQTNAAAATA